MIDLQKKPETAEAYQQGFRNELELAELRTHLDDLEWHWWTAYERFQMYGNPADRDDAVLWLHMRNVAQQQLPAAVQAARFAEIDESIGFFTSNTALAMAQPGYARRAGC